MSAVYTVTLYSVSATDVTCIYRWQTNDSLQHPLRHVQFSPFLPKAVIGCYGNPHKMLPPRNLSSYPSHTKAQKHTCVHLWHHGLSLCFIVMSVRWRCKRSVTQLSPARCPGNTGANGVWHNLQPTHLHDTAGCCISNKNQGGLLQFIFIWEIQAPRLPFAASGW